MNLNKICPDCETEYLPHIYKCADCDMVLVTQEEYKQIQEEKRRVAEQAIRDAVVIRKGDLKWIDELYNVLIDSKIPCTVISDAGCKRGSCGGDDWRLVTAKEELEKAKARIEEYFMEMYPEIRAANELASQGKCPACGSPVSASATECPDCGLALVIIEEEEDEE